MMTLNTITRRLRHASKLRIAAMASLFAVIVTSLTAVGGCERNPELHLYIRRPIVLTLSEFGLRFDAYWNYELLYEVKYDWQAEWYNCYGWDEKDEEVFGPIGYPEPENFNLYRYYTGSIPYVPHNSVLEHFVRGHEFVDSFELGYWDLLVYNQLTRDPADTHIDKSSTLDSVFAYTSPDAQMPAMRAGYPSAFYQPEAIYSAYKRGIEISGDYENDDTWSYDSIRSIYIKRLDMTLMPVTYIYLTQVILRHNKKRITAVEGRATLSGMARSTNLNTGYSGSDDVSHYYHTRMKYDRHYLRPFHDQDDVVRDETADMIGGVLMTFGMPTMCANYYLDPSVDIDQRRRDLELKQLTDVSHYMDVKVLWNTGGESTLSFDVTDQVRKHFRGGVITVEVDVDTLTPPNPKPHSSFDAVVKDYEEETHEIEMKPRVGHEIIKD